MKLYRVFPYNPNAKNSEAGHPLFIPASRSTGRINNPDIYQSSYWSAQPECAVAEVFGTSFQWSETTFMGLPQIKNSYQAIATIEISDSVQIFEMDDARNLVKLKVKPSRVVTRNNAVTQAWAKQIFEQHKYIGVSWWSIWWPEWQSLGLWSVKQVKVVDVEALNVEHQAVIGAAETLGKRVLA